MAKKSSIQREKRREELAKKYAARRARLKAVATNRDASPEERFQASCRLSYISYRPKSILAS